MLHRFTSGELIHCTNRSTPCSFDWQKQFCWFKLGNARLPFWQPCYFQQEENLRNAKLIAGLSHLHFLRVNFVRACVPPRHRSAEKHEVEKNNLYFLYEISSQRGATRIALLVKEETRMLLKLLQSWHMRLHRQICLVNAGSMLKLSRSRSHSSI